MTNAELPNTYYFMIHSSSSKDLPYQKSTNNQSTIEMAQAQQNPSKMAQAQVRFSDEKHHIVPSDDQSLLRHFPPPSPAPVCLRRRKFAYRPLVYVLEVIVICLVAIILVLLAIWAYHLARHTYSSGSSMWERGIPRKKLQGEELTAGELPVGTFPAGEVGAGNRILSVSSGPCWSNKG
jgi:hypothetical protein